MLEPKTACEIIRQSDQGISVRPFLVRASDGSRYFVKGLSRAGGASLISEAIAAELGTRLGLPIPHWTIMTIPDELISFSSIENVSDLSGGPAFASLQVENATELSWSGVSKIPNDLQRLVLAFDLWINNGDRALSESGGNVNLLLDSIGNLSVIDHNAAFDQDFQCDSFRECHVFRDQIKSLRDYVTRQDMMNRLDGALACWDMITALLPDEWILRDIDDADETIPTLLQRYEVLRKFREERFWGQL